MIKMKRNFKIILAVITFTLIAGFLRFYNIVDNPVSLNIDEVAYGYSAYSILKTGRDENGVFMPLTFSSIGDYKNPVLIYSLVPSIAIFGLNEFSVRFTSALAGTLTIPAFFIMMLLLKLDKKVTLIGTALLTISPWHIYYSRFASDHIMGLLLLVLGISAFQKMLTGKKLWIFLASFLFVLSMYTYHSQRFFVPMLVSGALILNKGRLNFFTKKLFVFFSMILVTPLIYLSIFGSANSRAAMVFLSQDIDFTRYIIIDHLQKEGEIFLLFFFWIKRYLNYFQPGFLFFNGLNMTAAGTLGLGVLYLYELPWLILGIIKMITKSVKNEISISFRDRGIILLWLILGIIPASLTNNEQNSGRTLLILPALLIIISFGVISFFQMIRLMKNRYLKTGLTSAYLLFIMIILTQAFLVFAVHFPKQKGEAFMEGTKETVLYALKNKDKYDEIIYDPYRGIEAPYIVNIPYMYILFYSQYDPAFYQKETKRQSTELYGFDKFTIRRIDWREDRKRVGTLFIGSPWSLPEKDISKEEILRKVYLSGGQLVFFIVSPKEK